MYFLPPRPVSQVRCRVVAVSVARDEIVVGASLLEPTSRRHSGADERVLAHCAALLPPLLRHPPPRLTTPPHTPPTTPPTFPPTILPLASQPPNYTEATPEPAAAFDPEPTTCAAASQAVISPKSYSTAASQPAAVGPKLSSAASKLSADPKLSVAPSQPAADTTLLEVNTCMCICVACAALAWLLHGMCT